MSLFSARALARRRRTFAGILTRSAVRPLAARAVIAFTALEGDGRPRRASDCVIFRHRAKWTHFAKTFLPAHLHFSRRVRHMLRSIHQPRADSSALEFSALRAFSRQHAWRAVHVPSFYHLLPGCPGHLLRLNSRARLSPPFCFVGFHEKVSTCQQGISVPSLCDSLSVHVPGFHPHY
jgi:hypothetical protein